MSFWVDPFALFLLGAILFIVSVSYKIAKSVLYALIGAILTSFIFGGAALYLDWYRWVIPGIADLKGSYVIFDQGLTGITKNAFPAWIAMTFLTLYPLWLVLGYETAKKYNPALKFLPILIIGVILLSIPSVIQAQFLNH
jgi:hypothetical protein